MCSGSEAGSCIRLVDFVHHSTLGLRVINKKKTYEKNRVDITFKPHAAPKREGVVPGNRMRPKRKIRRSTIGLFATLYPGKGGAVYLETGCAPA